MLVMTTKIDWKKLAIVAAAVLLGILGLVLLLGGGDAEAASANFADNSARVEFLQGFGWEVETTPAQSSQVRIPSESSEVFERYNALQIQQGYDLTDYAGKTVMRYVYTVTNYTGATEAVYATLLVYKGAIIGGDVTDTSSGGVLQGFARKTQASE
ncbi:MAG: DUF4830 domain-containing protein [Firmicutes bacterium]|nr:DUF4830 domain-containing protein [Bacillota bacterium]